MWNIMCYSAYQELAVLDNLLTTDLFSVFTPKVLKSTQQTKHSQDRREPSSPPDYDPLRIGPPRRPTGAHG